MLQIFGVNGAIVCAVSGQLGAAIEDEDIDLGPVSDYFVSFTAFGFGR